MNRPPIIRLPNGIINHILFKSGAVDVFRRGLRDSSSLGRAPSKSNANSIEIFRPRGRQSGRRIAVAFLSLSLLFRGYVSFGRLGREYFVYVPRRRIEAETERHVQDHQPRRMERPARAEGEKVIDHVRPRRQRYHLERTAEEDASDAYDLERMSSACPQKTGIW